MKPVKLSELIEALEFDFEETRTFVDLENGCVVMVQGSVLSDVEEGDEEALSDVPDWQKDEVEIARAIVADSGKRFVAPPDKYEFHEYRELTSRTFRSLEEQLYLKKAQLKRQPNQHAAVLLPGQKVQLIKVATLRNLSVTGSQCEDFRQACIETAGCYKSPESAEAELLALEEKLVLEARSTITVTAESENGDSVGSSKAPVPIWTRTSNAGRNDRGANTSRRGGSKQTL